MRLTSFFHSSPRLPSSDTASGANKAAGTLANSADAVKGNSAKPEQHRAGMVYRLRDYFNGFHKSPASSAIKTGNSGWLSRRLKGMAGELNLSRFLKKASTRSDLPSAVIYPARTEVVAAGRPARFRETQTGRMRHPVPQAALARAVLPVDIPGKTGQEVFQPVRPVHGELPAAMHAEHIVLADGVLADDAGVALQAAVESTEMLAVVASVEISQASETAAIAETPADTVVPSEVDVESEQSVETPEAASVQARVGFFNRMGAASEPPRPVRQRPIAHPAAAPHDSIGRPVVSEARVENAPSPQDSGAAGIELPIDTCDRPEEASAAQPGTGRAGLVGRRAAFFQDMIAPPSNTASRSVRELIDEFGGSAATARPLGQSVAAWYPAQQRAEVRELWRGIGAADPPAAGVFSNFLDQFGKVKIEQANADNRLSDVRIVDIPHYQTFVPDWLTQLAQSEPLRQDTYSVAIGATESCGDRLILTFNDMQQLRVLDDVRNGRYDNDLPQLIGVARELFRTGEIGEIAKRHANKIVKNAIEMRTARLAQPIAPRMLLEIQKQARASVEEIEIYLGYQIGLRKTLSLSLGVPTMLYPKCSGLKPEDVKKAADTVKARENADFINWLAQWPAWKEVVSRLDAEEYAKLNEWKYDLLEAAMEILPQKVEAEIQRRGLDLRDESISPAERGDLERVVSAREIGNIETDAMAALGRKFLENRGHADALKPVWDGNAKEYVNPA